MDMDDGSETYRILVVDDEPSVREALALGLTSQAFSVDTASDGASAFQLACECTYDVLIVDLSLPDIGGLEVIRRVRERHPETVPIVITASSTAESAAEALRAGALDYFEKPFHLEMIKGSIRQWLEKRELVGKALLQMPTE